MIKSSIGKNDAWIVRLDDFHADADTTKKEKYALSSSRTSNKSDESTAQNKIGHCTYLVFFRGGILHRGSFQRLFLGIQNFDSHDRKRARHTLKFFSSFALHTSSSCWFCKWYNGLHCLSDRERQTKNTTATYTKTAVCVCALLGSKGERNTLRCNNN